MKIAGVIVALCLLAPLAFGQTAADTAKGAKDVIKAIWEAVNVYYQDKGEWPKNLSALTDSGHYQDRALPPYVVIPADMSKEWEFSLDYHGGPSAIHADSKTIKVEGEVSGYEPACVSYDIAKGRWRGYGIPHYGRDTLSAQQKAELTQDARNALRAIYEGAKVYFQDTGIWPKTVEQLDVQHYIGVYYLEPGQPDPQIGMVSPSVFLQWQFALVGNPPQSVIAISTQEMPGGAGNGIVFDVETRTCSGYGTK